MPTSNRGESTRLTPMAAEPGPVSAAPSTTAILSQPPDLPSTTAASPPDPDIGRSKSLKRGRSEHSQNSANQTAVTNAGLGGSPSSKSARLKGAFSAVLSTAPLTGPTALVGEQRTRGETQKRQPAPMSENPGYKALSPIMAGGGYGLGRTEDVPGLTTGMSDGILSAANAISNPNMLLSDDKPEISPTSVTSPASLGSPSRIATASPTLVASPGPMTNEVEIREPRPAVSGQLQVPVEEYSPHRGPQTYPGNMLTPSESAKPSRGLSLPTPGQNQTLAPKSPSQKRWKCPYCDTEFTRHHNLKSHLLTHSQEKPYGCHACDMRFRRLHDLKRHSKLHTGERPHVCPKCDRKFARGDALARHTKGQGGCAGRRASMGGYGGEEDFEDSQAGEADDSGMDGIMYTNNTRQNEADMTEEEHRRFSLPTIKAQHVSGSQDNYNQRTPSTYPPAGPRPGAQLQSTGGLFPPNPDRGAGPPSSGASSSLQNSNSGPHSPSGNPSSTGGNSIFPHGGIIDSPRPLSPSGMVSHQLGQDPSMNRQRSPTLTTQFQPQQFGRRQSDRASPTSMSLPSPHPKLPALAGLGPPEQRYNMSGQTPNQPNTPNGGQPSSASPGKMYQPPMGSGAGRNVPIFPSHQQGSGGGDGSNNLFAGGERGVWAYVQTLEDKVKQLSDKVQAMEAEKKTHRDQVTSQQEQINQLSEELFSLRGNLSTQNQAQRPPASGPS